MIPTSNEFIKTVARETQQSSVAFLQKLFPAGRLEGKEYRVGSLQGEAGDSLSVNIRTCAWADFATGEKGGDLVSLYAAMHRMNQGEAAKALAAELGIADDKPSRGKGPSFWHPKHGEASGKWEYIDSDGVQVGYVLRFDTPDGKEVLPYREIEGRWRFKSFDQPRPLYGAHLLAKNPKGRVLVVEGEKCADAARRIMGGYVVITWPGGSKAVSRADWSAMEGREVIIWPDLDRSGIGAGESVADECFKHNAASVSILYPKERELGQEAEDE